MKAIIILFFVVFQFCIVSGQTSDNKKIPYGENPEVGRYFTSGDAKLYYEIYGKGEPLLLLHGGVYGYIDEFSSLIPKLSETHQVVCLASRAHGKSEIGHSAFTYQQRAEDAANLLNHLNISKALVVGFSDGGYTACKLASLYPVR
jgi:pimeloyl-ACP methyl ester carboxylesterase